MRLIPSTNPLTVIRQDALDIMVFGLVQGVGFRPFIRNLAVRLHLAGWIRNRNDGVHIRIQGSLPEIDCFLAELEHDAPPLARIEHLTTTPAPLETFTDFRIIASQSLSETITRVSPDVAVCQDCLSDMRQQRRRRNYPFINCTNCGPRFAIIQDLPYDRQQTTMRAFRMCPECQREYDDVRDRRFHAQPNACWQCGPRYRLLQSGRTLTDFEAIVERVCALLDGGKIVAIKGIGGFHLGCDATNEEAVARLRARKQREGKPFAVMVRNLDRIRRYAEVNAVEEALLLSEKRPIVLVKRNLMEQHTSTGMSAILSPSVTCGLDTLGVMLPYTPLQHVLFEHSKSDIMVLTSGNRADEPIVTADAEAEERLGPVADAILSYNRDIHNRLDDSVALVANHRPRLLRRSRGWVPEPIWLPFDAEGIVATGGELKTCFCVGKGRQAILSQHIGDLENFETYAFYQEAFTRFQRLFRVTPTLIACDLHPDYVSSRFAQATGLPCVAVQHHHAHIAACLAEFGVMEPVIGVGFDGTGLGADGAMWGGEFLICDLSGYRRVSHFDYVPLPGGDKAAEQPWRMGLAYLYAAFGRDIWNLELPLIQSLDRSRAELLLKASDAGIQSPPTSSVGRLFDAVAAITGLVSQTSFEAEAPLRLEAAIDDARYGSNAAGYPYRVGATVDAKPLIEAVTADVLRHVATGTIAAKFHHTLVSIIVDLAGRIRGEHGLKTVVLSGGVFQNRHLVEKAEVALQAEGFTVYSPFRVPANDGGLCLGQLAVAAMKSERRHPCRR